MAGDILMNCMFIVRIISHLIQFRVEKIKFWKRTTYSNQVNLFVQA